MISASFIDEKASHSQIDRYSIIREYFQFLFLRYFYEVEDTKGIQAYFKGGTALRFLFDSFRFSEDLDFTCGGAADEVGKVLSALIPKLEAESGCEILIKDERVFEERGVGYRLVFQSHPLLKQPLGVRLDFSFREPPLEPEVSAIEPLGYPVSPFPLVKHLSAREILTEKVRAIFVRNQPRDLFDLWFLLKRKTEMRWDFVAKKMEYYPNISFSREILLKKIEGFKPEELKKDLNKFLPRNYREYYPKFVKEVLSLLKAAENEGDSF